MDLEKVKKTLARRYDQRMEKLENQRLTFLHQIKTNLSKFLCEFPSVSKMVVFGSLVRAGYFTELSDVDIAIKGLPNKNYWQALLWLERCLGFEDIDLVRIEDANPRILKYINHGKIVYEKEI
ncbi:MAG: nucleotidyltransferase family protein [bacterium]